jgi:hypothetical protein
VAADLRYSGILILTRLRLRLRLRKKKVPGIHYFHRKIREVPQAFLNLSLNLNLAILKMRIAVRYSQG